jgi:pre-mRNA-processing factor 19
MVCEISGEPLQGTVNEVVVTPSGHICIKRLLLTKLSENGGLDPFESKLPLSEDQLVTLQTPGSGGSMAPPRPQATSLPNLLGLLQKEYDAMVSE